jgi:aminomethyltransferase
MTELRRTPLYDAHVALGGKMVPFAGYSLPVHFSTGIRDEHRAVRRAAGLFDVSHMGQVEVSGRDALAFVQHLTVNDAGTLEVGQAQYSLMCRETGGVIDDLLVYRLDGSRYLLVVNGARRTADMEWIRVRQSVFDVSAADRADEHALVALQGPRAEAILARVAGRELTGLLPNRHANGSVDGVQALVSRTGYTGEDGFEVRTRAADAATVWATLLDAGSAAGLTPAGLGARDTLRLEVGYPLYGADLDEEHTPLEAGLGWAVKIEKGGFVGRDALLGQRHGGVARRLRGIRLEERGFPRPGYPVVAGGREVAEVTSGTVSPELECGIALAYLPAEHAAIGTPVFIRVRGRDLSGKVSAVPFYTGGSRRRG